MCVVMVTLHYKLVQSGCGCSQLSNTIATSGRISYTVATSGRISSTYVACISHTIMLGRNDHLNDCTSCLYAVGRLAGHKHPGGNNSNNSYRRWFILENSEVTLTEDGKDTMREDIGQY